MEGRSRHVAVQPLGKPAFRTAFVARLGPLGLILLFVAFVFGCTPCRFPGLGDLRLGAAGIAVVNRFPTLARI